MTLYYNLKINTSENKYEDVNNILGVKSNSPHCGWQFGITWKENDPPLSFIEYFLSILSGKYDDLEKIGIYRDDISVWLLYEYEEQCNMEFSPTDMYNLGKQGIVLCVSCWEK